MKFCDNPKCECHQDVPDYTTRIRIPRCWGLNHLDYDEFERFQYSAVSYKWDGTQESKTLWFCDVCRGAIEVVNEARNDLQSRQH